MPELIDAPAPRRDTMQERLSNSLAGVLRKLGLVGKATPSDERLVAIAVGYAQHKMVLATDDGQVVTTSAEPFDFKACLGLPNDELDRSIPF